MQVKDKELDVDSTPSDNFIKYPPNFHGNVENDWDLKDTPPSEGTEVKSSCLLQFFYNSRGLSFSQRSSSDESCRRHS